MKSLEITPLKDKKLTVLIVEKEYNEPFWIIEQPSNLDSRIVHSLFKPSVGFYRFIENIVKKIKPDFATEELGMRSHEQFYRDNILAQVFLQEKIPFYPVDIDGNAKAYLAMSLDKKRELRDSILTALDNISKQKSDETSLEREYLVAYGQCLQSELEEQEHEIGFPIRESWIVMEILEHAKEIADRTEVACLHICSPDHVEGVKKLLESLDVKVEVLKLTKKIVSTHAETPVTGELENLLQSIQVQVKPVITASSDDAPYLLFYLDTDEKASPFDICMAYDAGYTAVVPYEKITAEDAKRIVQDTVFSRGPKAVKRTCFFIGGKNVEKAEEVFEALKNTMFPPFKTSVIIDPGGAYTTAAALVAKVEDAVASAKLGDLKSKICAVLGTGAVGQVAAVLLAKLGCNVLIASINPERKDGREYAERVSKLLATKYGVSVQGVFAPSSVEKLELLKKADIIICAGTRGTRVLEKDLLKEVRHLKVVVDINAIPPFGVEGIELKDDMREMLPGIFTIGALTVGDLKHKLEKEILREARTNGREVYNYNLALEIARKILQKEISVSKLKLTLSYPPPKKTTK